MKKISPNQNPFYCQPIQHKIYYEASNNSHDQSSQSMISISDSVYDAMVRHLEQAHGIVFIEQQSISTRHPLEKPLKLKQQSTHMKQQNSIDITMTDSQKQVDRYLKKQSSGNNNMKLIRQLFRQQLRRQQIQSRFNQIRQTYSNNKQSINQKQKDEQSEYLSCSDQYCD